ncbi:MAG TPA: thioredoxin-disulfide reductase [Thermotogota bacterium]|nr:thioredoxin-disulfide reductase [Thermotogota bacterium]HRW92285.1 thioredoxin-disulfide reductase [Thermotogota bacterium]
MVFFDTGDAFKAPPSLDTSYDMIIIGGGAAGLTAALYAARGSLKVLVVEKAVEGGQMVLTQEVENYPGFLHISGDELADKMREHATHFGATIANAEVLDVQLSSEHKRVVLDTGQTVESKVLVIATGAGHRHLNVPGEREFEGRGVSYCAICDGTFFRDKDVAVIGGGNSAIDEGLYLAKLAKSVKVVHRRNSLRAEKILAQRAFQNPKMDFVWNSVVKQIKGSEQVSSLLLENTQTHETSELSVDGVFIYIGIVPHTQLFRNFLQTDESGFIVTQCGTLETSVPGVFAAGDVVQKELRQIVNAAADGALAATMAIRKYFE